MRNLNFKLAIFVSISVLLMMAVGFAIFSKAFTSIPGGGLAIVLVVLLVFGFVLTKGAF